MSIFKDSFTPIIRDQLTIRGEAFKKRSSNDIIYINGRSAWVRMTSGVDVDGFGDVLAKENILQGGVLQSNGNQLRSGVGTSYNNNVYSSNTNGLIGINNNLHGLRPMPGITSLDISSKSAYGSIRVASVNFNCWDIKQLELMETLYMRPGFMVLIEWGWLPYLDNKGNIKSNTSFYDIFDTKTNKPLQERLIDVYNQSKKSDGNYEGILGYIKNYEWSARADGGYDCRTEIISTGEILESLKINYSTLFVPPSELKTGLMTKGKLNNLPSILPKQQNTVEKLYSTNIVAGIAGELIFSMYNYISTFNKDAWDTGKSYDFYDTEGKLTGVPSSRVSMFGIDISKEGNQNSKNNDIEPNKQIYINLEAFLNILNKWVIPVDQINKKPIVPLSSNNRTYIDGKNEPLLCLYHPLQISVDPSICLIKNTKIKAIKNISIENKQLNSIFIPEKLYPNNQSKQTFSLFTKNWLKKLITDASSTGIEDRALIIRTSIDSLIEVANRKGISKKEATEIIANAWEEYKYLNVSIPTIQTEKPYVVLSPNGSIISNSATIDGISKIDFKDFIKRISAFRESYKLALGDDFQLFYIPNTNVALLSETSIKTKLSSIESENIKSKLEFQSIEFLDLLGLNYESNGLGIIGNIYVNLNNIIELSVDGALEGNDVKEKREINLYDFLKKLVNQIQGSIGSINNFDIHVDPIDGVARIIDINYVDALDKTTAYKNAYTFMSKESVDNPNPKLDALFNNVRSYKFSSQIFKEQSSIVAISAQNGGGVMGLDNETLVGFQTGLTNRLLPNSNPISVPIDFAKETISNNILINTINSSLKIFMEFLQDMNWIKDQILLFDKTRIYKIQNTEKYKNQLRDFIAAYQSISTTKSSFRSIIPTVLSLELDGIGGLVIGHIFKFPLELIPAGYKTTGLGRKQGYIITKLGHKLSNSDWVTTIDAQTIILEDDNSKPKFNLDESISKALSESQVKISIEPDVTPSSNTTVEDLWTLVAISAAENFYDNLQGMADVAQSIYNRFNAGGYGKTIKQIILAPNQYEPVFKNKADWNAINSKQTAIVALQNSKNISSDVASKWIDNAYNAIKDANLRRNAALFVGSRTEFLASSPNSLKAEGMVEREPKNNNNSFYWRYNGKTVFYDKNIFIATPIPKNILVLI